MQTYSVNAESSTIEKYIEENGVLIQTSVGYSMYPMLRSRKDNVVIEKVTSPLKKYDVPLYKTRDGSKYILHRIIKIKDGKYVIRGDNTYVKELWVTDDLIVGVLKGFYRGDKYHSVDDLSYKIYVRLNIVSYPIRLLYRKVKVCIKKIRDKIFRKNKKENK